MCIDTFANLLSYIFILHHIALCITGFISGVFSVPGSDPPKTSTHAHIHAHTHTQTECSYTAAASWPEAKSVETYGLLGAKHVQSWSFCDGVKCLEGRGRKVLEKMYL